MKYTLLTIALFFAGTTLFAQEEKTDALTTPAIEQGSKDEIRAMAGALKETLTMVTGYVGNANKLAGSATPENKETATATRDRLVSTQKDLEAALSEVSSATPENWNEVKAKAEATNSKAIEMASQVKGNLQPAVD